MNLIHVNGMSMPRKKGKWQIRHTQLKYLMAMKLFVLILILSANVSANAYSQKIDLSVSNGSLRAVMQDLRKQTGYNFFFKSDILKNATPVNVRLKQASLEETLEAIFKDQPFRFEIKDNGILIKVKEKPSQNLLDKVKDIIKAISITGKVTDESGSPLPGVSVVVKDSKAGTVTDTEGAFKLDANSGDVLTFSFIGYRTEELPVKDETVLNVVLRQLTAQLDQVQVIGYGTTTRRTSTGNISSVRSNVIGSQPVTNPLLALSGRVAGLQITQNNGLPGTNVSVQIRGRNSIAAGNSPLYVMDGVPFLSTSAERLAGPMNAGAGSALNTISPADIESIEILKDADATAIYGSRAANGVILITTKRGMEGKTKLDVNVATGFGEITRAPKVLTTQQYLQVRRDALANSNMTPDAANAPDLVLWNAETNNHLQDWYLKNTANITNTSATISGGNSQINFLFSGAYRHESTIQPGSNGYDRGNMHLNVGYLSLDKKFQMIGNVFFTTDYNRLKNNDNATMSGTARSVPNYPTYDASGNYYWTSGKTNYNAQMTSYYKGQTDNLNANITVKYKLLPDLDLKGNLGYNKLSNDQKIIYPSSYYDPAFRLTGNSFFTGQVARTYLFEPQISYSKKMSKGQLDALVGGTIQRISKNSEQFFVNAFPSDLLLESLAFGTVASKSGNSSEYNYLSAFGRVTYNWDSKYIVNVSFRRDGSSRFGSGKQFGNFDSIGVAWIYSNERFIKDQLSFMSYGKLRGSYGTTGNDGIADYAYLNFYDNSSNYDNINAILPAQLANNDYRWELNKKLELGADLGFYKDKILFNVAWYRNRSGNQLVSYPLPATTGFTGYVANLPAVVQNSGWEFEVNTINLQNKNFSWSTAANLTIAKNKLVSFPGIENTSYAGIYIVGQPLSTVQKLQFLGVDPETGIANILDINKDGNYTLSSSYNNQGGDFINAGTTDPKWFAGLSNNFSYKHWSLDVFFQYTRQKGYNLQRYNFGGLFNTWENQLGYWKKPGDQTSIPKPFAASVLSRVYYNNSDAIFADASFLRLKNVSLSYTLPQRITQKLRIDQLRLFLQGNNILTITDYMGYDPETAGNFDPVIPPLKVYTIGIQCTL